MFYTEHDRLLTFEPGLILFELENTQLGSVRLFFKDNLAAICMLLTVAPEQKAEHNSGCGKNKELILIPNKKQTSQKEYAIIVKGDDYGKEI